MPARRIFEEAVLPKSRHADGAAHIVTMAGVVGAARVACKIAKGKRGPLLAIENFGGQAFDCVDGFLARSATGPDDTRPLGIITELNDRAVARFPGAVLDRRMDSVRQLMHTTAYWLQGEAHLADAAVPFMRSCFFDVTRKAYTKEKIEGASGAQKSGQHKTQWMAFVSIAGSTRTAHKYPKVMKAAHASCTLASLISWYDSAAHLEARRREIHQLTKQSKAANFISSISFTIDYLKNHAEQKKAAKLLKSERDDNPSEPCSDMPSPATP